MAKHSKNLDKTQQKKFQNPFKQKLQSQSAPKPQPDELEDDVPDFPRGGRKTLNKEELEEVMADVDAEFESEERDLKKKRKNRSKKSGQHSIEDELGSLFRNEITGKLPRFASKITLKVPPILSEVESRSSIPSLEVPLDDDDDDDDTKTTSVDGTKGEMASKGNRCTKKKEKEKREQEIIAAEERLLEKDLPRTPDDFEKLVRSSPNSSFVWIKYMGFMLSLSDVEKARLIAERALRTINIREESEKLNIWVAYFNLENEYGDPPEDAVVKLFQRALQYCDPKKVHLALLGMYERTEQHKLADELLDKMLKKFKHSCKVWLRRIQRLLKENQDGIQSVVKRALICLPRHKHIKFITQTAILEFKCGVPDRGRSMFEGMLREYPKRTDLWGVYLDQEIRLGDVGLIHAVFERAISMSLPPKKMKILFKKYLEFEKSLGDEEQIEYVKRKALEYVETTVG